MVKSLSLCDVHTVMSLPHALRGYFHFLALADHMRGRGFQIHQLAHRASFCRLLSGFNDIRGNGGSGYN
jgi:hypothetical protein